MSNKLYMYVSSWKEHGGQPGIGFYTLDEENGHIEFVKMINEEDSVNCSYVDRTDGIIYFCNEVVHIPNVNCNSGSIIGCRILKQNGELLPVFRQPTYCPNPSFLSLDKTGRYMLVAHHSVASGVARDVYKRQGLVSQALWHRR